MGCVDEDSTVQNSTYFLSRWSSLSYCHHRTISDLLRAYVVHESLISRNGHLGCNLSDTGITLVIIAKHVYNDSLIAEICHVHWHFTGGSISFFPSDRYHLSLRIVGQRFMTI